MKKYAEWLETIKRDIQIKYNIVNPIFVADLAALQDKDLYSWLSMVINDQYPDRWLEYKKIGILTFELKPFAPDPDKNLVKDIINKFLNTIPYEGDHTYFTVNKFVYVENKEIRQYNLKDLPGETYYNFPEIKVELECLARNGFSKITLKKKSILDDGKIIYHLHVEQDSIENMLKSGFLELEYK